jgi:hypothetical protein
MTYAVAPEIEFKPAVRPTDGAVLFPQVIFRLDTGDLVAMEYETKQIDGNNLSCRICAWLVDEQGDAQMTALDRALVGTEFKHTAPPQQLIQLGPNTIATLMRDLVLGDAMAPAEYPGGAGDDPIIPWSQELKDCVNIRYAIAVARAIGETIDLTL